MSFNIIPTPPFERELKKLSKKHVSLKKDFITLLTNLKQNALMGVSIGNDCYKIRLAITSKNKGKSGGARIVTYVQIVNESIYLLSIYDKSDQSTISDDDILSRLKNL